MQEQGPQPGTIAFPDFAFADGTVVDLEIGYWTLGTLAPDRGNAILLCHGASGNRDWALPFCRPGGAFDPALWYLISIDLPGGGGSSRRASDPRFPARYGLRDLTRAVAGVPATLGIDRLAAICGPSLATLVALDLAALHPERVGALALWNGGIRADGFAAAVAEAVATALESDATNAIEVAVRAFLPAMIGSLGMADSQVEARSAMVARIVAEWQRLWQPGELVARYLCVGGGDVPALHGGEQALARRLVQPILWLCSQGDLLLPPEPVARFARSVPAGEVRVAETMLGHVSTGTPPGSPEFRFFDEATADFFGRLR